MINWRGSILRQGVVIGLCLCGVVPVAGGCTWVLGKGKPTWVDGRTLDYPSAHYLTGVGQADNRSRAEDRAYAAVARIFTTAVTSQAKDREFYSIVENRGIANVERRLTIDSVTKVSTEKVLENVRVMDNWYDSDNELHYALAVMNRSQAEASLMNKLQELDRAITAEIAKARQADDKLVKVRALLKAGRNTILREAYNTDLRVIRHSGQGIPSAYRPNELFSELEQFLAVNLALAAHVSGDQAELAQHALVEGLLREGLHVRTQASEADTGSPELLVRGTVRLFPVKMGDPHFKYVRWCSDFEVLNVVTGQVIGAVARGGKEGHLTESEAVAKTLRVMQQEVSSEVAKAIAAQILDDDALPVMTAMPVGCPREESTVSP
ncbi:MAG: LPP20 family lipoprotein [Nitrospira sp.]|nr:LPP20 family lipoprotein [Nitrospira sp.]